MVSADNLRGRQEYVRQLSRIWLGVDVDADLAVLLSRMTASKPAYQIVTRFHKIVRTLDHWVLGELRDAEQTHRLRTVTISPLSYGELRRRWRAEGIPFCVSDYGEAPKHLREDLLPCYSSDVATALVAAGAPRWLLEMGMSWTGGYPLPLDMLVDQWRAEGRPSKPLPEVRRILRRVVEQTLARMIELLDADREDRFRNALCDLYQGLNTANARYLVQQHDWHEVLLNEAGQLRAEGVGAAAEAKAASLVGVDPWRWRDLFRRGVDLYRMRKYSNVQRLLARFDQETLRPHLLVLRAEAQAMELLFNTAGSSGGTLDWPALSKVLEAMVRLLDCFNAELPDARVYLRPRVDELADIADEVSQAMKLSKRYVDELSGLSGRPGNSRLVALLLTLHLESARLTRDHDAAMKSMMVLPEQIFRSWAQIALGLNYYQVPSDSEGIWDRANAAWLDNAPGRTPLRRSEAGKAFESFACFAYFALAWKESHGLSMAAPEEDIRALQSSLSFLETRNDSAHAISWVDERVRGKYSKLTERWLDALCLSCPDGIKRGELLALIEPLPLLGEDGRMI